jgi:hypothetical protein
VDDELRCGERFLNEAYHASCARPKGHSGPHARVSIHQSFFQNSIVVIVFGEFDYDDILNKLGINESRENND